MFGLSNTVLYVIGAVVAAAASAVIGWNVWRNVPAPAPPPETPPVARPDVPSAGIAPAVPGAPPVSAPQAALQSAPQANAPSAPAIRPQFDVVRVEPSGDTVIAGRAAPQAKVTLFASGKPVAEVTANAEGQFALLPPALPPGDHLLSLQAGAVVSEQTVAVVVPPRGGRDVVVALAEPDKPTRILSDSRPAPVAPAGSGAPTAAAPGAPAPAPGGAAPSVSGPAMSGSGPVVPASDPTVTIRAVEAQQGGGFFISGLAAAGAQVRLYLNDAFIAMAEPGADGRWSVRVEKGMSAGQYAVRADLIGKDGARVVARAEVPFDYPAPSMALVTPPAVRTESAPQNASKAPQTPANAPDVVATANPTVVPELRTAKVERGDSLWRISRSVFGQGVRYTQIYDANTHQIRNPRLIYPGQVLVVPNPVVAQ